MYKIFPKGDYIEKRLKINLTLIIMFDKFFYLNMLNLKHKIKNNFDRAKDSYELFSVIQKKSAFLLVDAITNKNFYPNTILDIGTGTGYVVEQLLKYHPSSKYHLNDVSSQMIEKCKRKFIHNNNVSFLNADMEILDVKNYDLIISNLALQWAQDLWACISKFNANSTVFAFSTLLKGTFQEWQDIIYQYENITVIKDYPTEKALVDYCSLLKNNHFTYWVKDFEVKFDSYLEFLRYLKSIGACTTNASIPINLLKKLALMKESTFSTQYKIFFGIFENFL